MTGAPSKCHWRIVVPKMQLKLVKKISHARLADGAIRLRVWNTIVRTAFAIVKEVQLATPVRTGRLRASYQVAQFGKELRAEVGTNVSYAPYIEFGTRRLPARPHLRPPFEARRESFGLELEQAMLEAQKAIA